MEDKIIKQANSLANIASFDINDLTASQLSVIKASIAKGATDEELQWFLYQAVKLGLNPLLKEIWFIKRLKKVKNSFGKWDYPRLANGEPDYRGAELVIMTSNDGYMKKAAENPEFKGIQAMEVRVNDEFEMQFDGEKTTVSKHKWKATDRGEIVGAWAVATYKDGTKDWNYVQFEEYCQYYIDKDNKKSPTGVWANNPSAMIKKCAMSPLLKRAGKLSGIYTEEEMSKDAPSVELLDNSPTKANVREDEMQKIIQSIEGCKTMEDYRQVVETIGSIGAGLLAEEMKQIRSAASAKKKSLDEALNQPLPEPTLKEEEKAKAEFRAASKQIAAQTSIK